MELYETEERYVDDLKLIITHILQPIRTLGILDEDMVRRVFQNIEAIYLMNTDFLRELKRNISIFYPSANRQVLVLHGDWR
jgi:hypothetical protein